MAVASKERDQISSSNANNRKLLDEMLLEVIAKLPPKSVLRFKCVSKHWLSLITDPQFIDFYEKRSDTRPGGVNIVIPLSRHNGRDGSDFRFLIVDLNQPPQSRATVHYPKALPRATGKITNMVNGIVCFYDCVHLKEDIYAYNLSTREFLALPPPRVKELRPSWTECYLGFSPATKEYKLFRYRHLRGGAVEREVFSLGGSSWRDISKSVPNDKSFKYIEFDFCVDGVLYGRTCYPDVHLLALDVEHETYKILKYPPGRIIGSIPHFPTLVHLQGQVALVDFKQEVGCHGDIEVFLWRLINQKSNDSKSMLMWSHVEKITCSTFVGISSPLGQDYPCNFSGCKRVATTVAGIISLHMNTSPCNFH